MNYRTMTVILLLAVMTSFSLTGCISSVSGVDPQFSKPDEAVLNAFDPDVARPFNQFGMELFAALFAAEKENTFISPTSIATALAMTYNGARQETKEAMARALGVEGVELKRLNENNLALLYLLQEADPEVKFNIANSLWMRAGVEFDPDFMERNEKHYNATLRDLDFNSPAAADIINQWVKERTGGLIEDIIEPPIDPQTILFLINAIYFQADWSEPFNRENTREDSFHLLQGETVSVPFMHRYGDLDYLEEEGFQAVRLPYGEGRLAMYVFLPAQDTDLATLISNLDAEKWEQWQRGFQEAAGNFYLPRFSMEYEKTLNDVLKELGMDVAFDEGRADLFDMVTWEGSPRLYISEVKHKSFIEVDELGTEAAAATSVEIRLESAPAFHFEMKVNRPFFFLIHDHATGAIPFIGTVLEP